METKLLSLNKCVLFFILLNCLAYPYAFAQPIERKFIPQDDKVLLVVGQDKATIERYIKKNNHVPGGFMVYTSIQQMDGLFNPAIERGAGIQHAQYFVDKYPNTVIQLGLYMVGALQGVVDGKYDASIEKLARWAKDVRIPIYLRIGYEFDFPQNGYTPQLYKNAYRYIVDRLRHLGADNIVYVWHSYGNLTKESSLTQWYPGNDYVDWLGVSIFYVYQFDVISHFAALAHQFNKPLMIAEASPVQFDLKEGNKAWKRWFEPLFALADKHHVKMICYINSNWASFPMFKAQHWRDARIENNKFIQEKWRNVIKQEKYLSSGYQLFQNLD